MFIVYSAVVMRIEAASGNTSPPCCQTARSAATMRMKPTPAATVAHSAESIGISTASTAPPMTSSTTSAPSMYGGFCFRSRSSIPAIRLAWISTPGKTLSTGVERRSCRPGAVVPIRAILPLKASGMMRSLMTSLSER